MVSILLTTGAAHAGGFAEVAGGAVVPVGDDDYENAVDTSLKLGVHVGSTGFARADQVRFGFELGFDWTALSSDFDTAVTDESFHRIRGLVGGRAVVPLAADRVVLIGRFAAGVDVAYASVSGQILGVEFENSETNIGLALDPSVAVVGKVAGNSYVGLQVGVPISVHDDDPEELDLDYTSVDIDFLLVLGTSM
jgi:hypothetical protein